MKAASIRAASGASAARNASVTDGADQPPSSAVSLLSGGSSSIVYASERQCVFSQRAPFRSRHSHRSIDEIDGPDFETHGELAAQFGGYFFLRGRVEIAVNQA